MEQSYVIRNDRVIGKTVPNINYNYSTCPIGSIFAFSSERIPLGFFICDGASYKVAEYPDLYAVIGNTYGGDTDNFNVPDYRETVLVGVGENTTDTIASHDVYELGEFKDDQLQGHWHNVRADSVSNDILNAGSAIDTSGHAGLSYVNTTEFGDIRAREIISDGTNGTPRVGTTTHGKQKGVTYIIKAFHTNEGVDSGVSDDVVEYLASELKTSENTDKTSIVYDAYMSSTTNESNFYIVRNGICYVYMDFTMTIDNPSGKGILLEKIPKPIGVINCQAMLYNNSTAPQGMLVLNTDGAITAEHNLKLGERYLCNFSYPIA